MNRHLSTTILGVALIGASVTATAADGASRRVVHPNAAGGETATTVTSRHGPNGGTVRRAGVTATAADGSVKHASGIAAQSAKGTLQSSGSASRDAAGNVTQSRNSSATSAATGNSVKTSSAYSKDSGVTRSASCFDASGASIVCPNRP